MTENVRLLDGTTNAAIVQLPGRRFPGLVIQGDTLHELLRVAVSDDDDALVSLRDDLARFVDHYRRVLDREGIALPWSE